jgi:hypothetical protein
VDYPPGTTARTFARIPARLRADAVQEAWVAHLSGKSPRYGAQQYAERELRYERHRLLMGNSDSLVPEDLGLQHDQFHGWVRDDA